MLDSTLHNFEKPDAKTFENTLISEAATGAASGDCFCNSSMDDREVVSKTLTLFFESVLAHRGNGAGVRGWRINLTLVPFWK